VTGDACPICLSSFESILDSGRPDELAGVTKLRCGHIFCIADIHEWINTSRGSCPTCRDVFLIIPEPSDDESSDGGEYIPGSDSIRDDFMDGDTWTDEEVDTWTDMEDVSLEEDLEEDTSSSWGRSINEGPDDVNAPTAGHLLLPMDSAMITGSSAEASQNGPIGTMINSHCEQIKNELIQWRTRISRIEPQDWLCKKDDTRATIHQGFYALSALKPRIEGLERDTPTKASFVYSALAAIQDLHAEMQTKLDLIHDIDLPFQEE